MDGAALRVDDEEVRPAAQVGPQVRGQVALHVADVAQRAERVGHDDALEVGLLARLLRQVVGDRVRDGEPSRVQAAPHHPAVGIVRVDQAQVAVRLVVHEDDLVRERVGVAVLPEDRAAIGRGDRRRRPPWCTPARRARRGDRRRQQSEKDDDRGRERVDFIARIVSANPVPRHGRTIGPEPLGPSRPPQRQADATGPTVRVSRSAGCRADSSSPRRRTRRNRYVAEAVAGDAGGAPRRRRQQVDGRVADQHRSSGRHAGSVEQVPQALGIRLARGTGRRRRPRARRTARGRGPRGASGGRGGLVA